MGRDGKLKEFYNFLREKVSNNKSSLKAKGDISKNNMTNTIKPIRLSKAAREFNVSTGTIVVYLNKKGYDISPNPNTKLTPEMYELLLKEYSKEKSVKEEAKRHSLKYSKRKSVSLDDEQKAKEEEDDLSDDIDDVEEEEDMEDTVFIKNSSSWAKTSSNVKEEESSEKSPGEKPEKKAEEKEDATTTSEEKKEEKPAEEEKPAAEEKPVAEEKKEAKKEEKAAEETQEVKPEEEKKVGGLNVLGKIDVDELEKKRPKKKGSKARKDETKPQKEKSKPQDKKKPEPETPKAEKQKPGEKAEKAAPKAKKETKDEAPASKEASAPKAEKKEKAAKPDQKKAAEPKQEKKEEKKEKPAEKSAKPAAEVKQEEKPEKTAEKPEEKKDDFLETKVERLDGPKILGTIDLPTESQKKPDKKKQDRRKDKPKKQADKKGADAGSKKKPVASSTDESLRPKKKKRRRISTGEQQRDDQNKQRQRQQGNKKQGKRPAAKKRHEPSEEEVQKQVKETLARLSGGGKSKSSKHRRTKRETAKVQQEAESTQQDKKVIQATEFVTVNELATMMDANVNQVISTCMSLGLFVSINQRLDAETITMVADEFGYEVEFVSVEVQEALESSDHEEDYDESDLEERAPIVTVMGHVDHGKTSLLDFIRKTNVIGGEAGGITQHIGAYEVLTQSGKKITFLDTPGHEAFTAMRARGAQVTDVAIIVIAADDKIMPQTIEAINHAQAAGVPTVFAINKIDKPGANPDKIKEELSQRNILVEEWGGKYQSHDISAKHGQGIDDLLEKVMLEAELLELKGNPKKHAKGTVVESSLDRGRGYISKLLVQEGTLHKGDYVLAGSHSGKVKAMYNERNQVVDSAGPSTPVLMLGLDGAPQAGDQFNVLVDEREAKEIAVKRRQLQREQGIRTQKHITLDEIGRRIAVGDFKELNIIVKGDVDGSVEALADSLLKQSTDEVQLNVIHKSVGQISESDVMLASASDAIIVGFQVRPSVAARKLAEKEQIDIRVYSVIYKAIEEIRAAIEGMLSPDIEEKIVCNLEIRDVFKITKVGTIAGCMVLDGTITRNTRVRVIRDGIVIYTGNLGSLKRYKDDVKEVKAGYECGLNIENFNDIKVGDIIEGFEEVEVARKL